MVLFIITHFAKSSPALMFQVQNRQILKKRQDIVQNIH